MMMIKAFKCLADVTCTAVYRTAVYLPECLTNRKSHVSASKTEHFTVPCLLTLLLPAKIFRSPCLAQGCITVIKGGLGVHFRSRPTFSESAR